VNGFRDTPRFVGEALERYAKVALFALVVVPLAPDLAADLATGAVSSALLRLAAIAVMIGVIVLLLWLTRKRSTRKHAAARAQMAGLGRYDVLVLPLSLNPEFRVTGREDAESVPELLIDGDDSLHPATVVLVRTVQVTEESYHAFVDNLITRRPDLRVEQVLISDAYDPERVLNEVRSDLTGFADVDGLSIWDAARSGRRTVAVDLTGATALVSIGLARLAHDLDARCVYVSGTRGAGGRFVLGKQDRHLVGVAEVFAAPG